MCHSEAMNDQGLDPESTEPTVLEIAPRHQAIGVLILVVVGAGLGVVSPFLIDWAQARDWLPFQGQLRLLQKLVDAFGSWVLIAAGIVLGGLVGLGLAGELSKVTVTDADVTIASGREKKRFSRAQVSRALYDDKHFVLRDDRDADLIRKKLDVSEAEVITALRQHGWPVA